MNKKFTLTPMHILVAVLGIVLAVLVTLALNFHLVDFKLYDRDLTELDLRGQEITASHYNKLKQVMPDCIIHWDIPFQGGIVADDVKEITLKDTPITQEDALALAYLPNLETIHGEDCPDYPMMAALKQAYPHVKTLYTLEIAGQTISSEATSASFDVLSQEDMEKLDYLLNLETLAARGGEGDPTVLQHYCQQRGLEFAVDFRGYVVKGDARKVSIKNITDSELSLLSSLKNMDTLHLVDPKAEPAAIFALEEQYPEVDVTWEVTLGSKSYSNTLVVLKELDLSKEEVEDVQQLEQALKYLPQVTQVFLGECGIPHEELAQLRDRVRDQYKVVWQSRFGEKGKKPMRTDVTFFFPARDGYVFNDDTSYNLRYCEDIICVDVGHLGVHDVSWLEGLVNLKYLILAHTGVTHLDGIENCKELKFLEVDWSGIRNFEPLKACTALEDLNFGNTWPDVTALYEMPWLKNVYMIYGSGSDAYKLSQALPDTKVITSGNATVASGWRKLPNYYAMRDALGAPYMEG